MIEEILNTKAKTRILKFLSEFPKEQFQAIDVARKTELSISRTSESLKELADKGVLESRKIGKGYLFKINEFNYMASIIIDLFRKDKKVVDIISKDFVSLIKKLGRIESIVLFGSAVKELKIRSDIDFLIISDSIKDRAVVSRITAELTGKYGFHISATVMTTSELKRKTTERFVINLIATNKLIFGKELEEIAYGKRS